MVDDSLQKSNTRRSCTRTFVILEQVVQLLNSKFYLLWPHMMNTSETAERPTRKARKVEHLNGAFSQPVASTVRIPEISGI